MEETGIENYLQRLELKSIMVPRKELLEKSAGPRLNYQLDNFLSDFEVTTLSNTRSSKPVPDLNEIDNYLELTKQTKFVERYSTFSLLPDIDETASLPPEDSRLSAFENILTEEKTRSDYKLKNKDSTMLKSTTSTAYNKFQEPSKQMLAFLRIKKKLENVERYCPTLYNSKDDIITIWGNMQDINDDKNF